MTVEILTGFRLVPKENLFWNSIPCERKSKKSKKLKQSKKSTKKRFDRAALLRVYVYLISSTSMQKENPFWNSVRQIKIRCAKYKFAERSHNFLPMQLIFGDPWDLDKLQTCAKGKFFLEFRSVWKEIQKIQKIKTEQKSTKKWFDRAALVYHWCKGFKMFVQFMEIWFPEKNLFLFGTKYIRTCLVVTKLYWYYKL